MDAANALERLSSLLTALVDSPYSLALHAQHIQLASLPIPELAEQQHSAVQLFLDFYAATDQVWLPFLREQIQGLGIPEEFDTADDPPLIDLQGIRVEALLDVLALFRKAEGDYLSIPILQLNINLLTLLHNSFVTSSNSELEPLLAEEAIRVAISDVASKGSSHLTKGHILWELQIAWELSLLDAKDSKDPERDILKLHIEALHIERLKQPHSTHEQTLQSYSSFVSAHCGPNEYESRLVVASQARAGPAKAWDKKERYELALVKGNLPSRETYQSYILSEQRVKSPNPRLLGALYERAIADFAGRRWDAVSSSSNTVDDMEITLRSLWCSYVDAFRAGDEENAELQVLRRAIRSVPGSGELWAKYIRALERSQDDVAEGMDDDAQPTETVADVYAKAVSISLIQQKVDQILPLVLAKAGFEKRRLKDQEGFKALVGTLESGISLVRQASPEGDPRMTLEKYLAGVYLNLEEPLSVQALALWQGTAKHYKTNYLAWNKYSELLIAEREYTRARALFKDISFKPLDWPEALWQAWAEFEHLHGSVEDIEHCLEKVQGLTAKLERKRAQDAAEAERAWLAASQAIPEHHAATTSTQGFDADAMVVDTTEDPQQSTDKKRKAEEPSGPEGSKRVKFDEKSNLKRDRENSTVFVSGLVAGTIEDDLVALFKDCGKIREIKITELPKSLVATVEFFDRGSVPAALTKDKKRVKDEEIAVHLAWQSTLYVTNFPEKTDDASIRQLFGTHGEIFDIRWPSKKYKSTRRFCYLQYTSPSAANSALSLHARELEPGRSLTVYISNPERKKERTDASANAREIYVAGLSKSVNEKDLKKLFEKYGTIGGVRMILDDKGGSKGFAFVEFENEAFANAALAANNQELKKRRIAVTLADTRVQPRQRGEGATRRSRTLRVKNLPPGTQEGLLQQTLEKHAVVRRVEVFQDKNEAIIELSSVAEAGKLLLIAEPIMFGDRTLELIEEDLPAPSRDAGRSGPMFVPRGAAGRPRAGIGSKKGLVSKKAISSTAAPGASTSATESGAGKGQDDFRRMLNKGG